MAFLVRKNWDSEFFNREIFACDLNYAIGSSDVEALALEIESLSRLDRPLIEARVRSEFFSNIPFLENIGFRLVDSRLEFRTKTYRRDFTLNNLPTGLRWFHADDWDEVQKLTIAQFVDNPKFKSRFNNRNYFTRDESVRYYLQWHRLALENEHPLFCVWETNSVVSGFYTIVRKSTPTNHVDYKIGLVAVRPGSEPSGMGNQMQFWIFQNSPDDEWTSINSPALTNLPALKNNIRAAKELAYAEIYLFWSY